MGFEKFRETVSKAVRHAKQHDINLRKKQLTEKARAEKAKWDKAISVARSDTNQSLPDTVQVSEAYLSDIRKRLLFNEDYGDFFMRLADEYNLPQLYNTGANVKSCHKRWFGDWYAMQRAFDVHSLSLCHNRFCSNCMHLRQATLLKRYTPVFEVLRQKYDLYHCVVTVPNCSGAMLKLTVDNFLATISQVLRYFRGNAKVAGVDFSQYGYVAAVRCLEIVVNETDYHPHGHMLLVLKKDLPLYKMETNCYSFKKDKPMRQFSEFEILWQKLMYLKFTGQKVTETAIRNLPVGYSCTVDKVEDDSWHEVFKYVTKLTKDGSMDTLGYEQFKDLYFALKGQHIVQGYGVLSKIAKDESIDDEIAEEYYKEIVKLRAIEDPVSLCRELDDLYSDTKKGHVRIISKYIIQRLLNEEAKENVRFGK